MRETNTRLLTIVSSFWAGQVENWPARVEFYIERTRDICFTASAPEIKFPTLPLCCTMWIIDTTIVRYEDLNYEDKMVMKLSYIHYHSSLVTWHLYIKIRPYSWVVLQKSQYVISIYSIPLTDHTVQYGWNPSRNRRPRQFSTNGLPQM